MINRSAIGYKYAASALAVLFLLSVTGAKEYISGKVWPEPKIIDPGPVGGPPSDALVLFGGNDMSAWEGGDKWEVADGVATAKGGGITTKQAFGNCQLHVEWAEPSAVTARARDAETAASTCKGNTKCRSSTRTTTKPISMASADRFTSKRPPGERLPQAGEWQSYDIISRPRSSMPRASSPSLPS